MTLRGYNMSYHLYDYRKLVIIDFIYRNLSVVLEQTDKEIVSINLWVRGYVGFILLIYSW